MKYEDIKPGETLQKDDEYSASHNQEWKSIPDFMIDSKVPDCPSTHWRRSMDLKSSKQIIKKISLFRSIISLFKKS